jgi:hypothetical protein
MATVNTTDPKPGYVYNADDDTWYPLLGLATQSLDGLTDVVITSPATNQIISYNGTNWVNTNDDPVSLDLESRTIATIMGAY